MRKVTFPELRDKSLKVKSNDLQKDKKPDYIKEEFQPVVEVNLTQDIYQSFLAHQLEKDLKLRGAKLCLNVSLPCICFILIMAFNLWYQIAYVMAALALSVVWVIELCPEIWLRAMHNIVVKKLPAKLSSYNFAPVVYTLRINGIEVLQDNSKRIVPYRLLRACVPFSDMIIVYLDNLAFIFPFDSFVDTYSEQSFFLTLEYRWAATQ